MILVTFTVRFMLTMFRFPKVMFSGFVALLRAAAPLCFVTTGTQVREMRW